MTAAGMDRTVRFLTVAAFVFAVTVIPGCSGGRAQEARDVAESFADAFYSADYETAAGLCSPELVQMIEESGAVVDSLPGDVREEFMELSRGVQTYTGDVHVWSKDSVTVDFDIIYPGEIEPMKTSLTVVLRPDTGLWKVVYAQERQ